MMKIRIYIAVLVALFYSASIWGQEVTMSIEQWDKHKQSIDSLNKVVLKLENSIDAQDSINKIEIHLKDTLIECLNNKFGELKVSYRADSMRLISIQDSLSQNIDSITSLNLRLIEMEKMVAFADRCIARFSNGRLFQPYDKGLVDEANGAFAKISTQTILREFEPIPALLTYYEPAFREIMTIIENAQKDQDRTNKFNSEPYRQKYTEELYHSQYYQLYFSKEWNIPYLNKQISRALKRLKLHNTKGAPCADFSDILEDNESQ